MEKEKAYKILKRTTIDALGTYGFREKFLQEINLLMWGYGNNHHSPNGKNILLRLEDLVHTVYSGNSDQEKIIQNFTNDVNSLRFMLGDFKINHGTAEYYTYTPSEEKKETTEEVTTEKKVEEKKSEEDTDFSNIYFDGLKKNPYDVGLLKTLPKKEREELKKKIEKEKNEVFEKIEIAKIGIYRTLAENQICYLFFNKHFDYITERNGIRNILRNYEGRKDEAKEIIVKNVKLFKENIDTYFEKINSAKKNLEEKTELNSLSLALAEYLINNFSPIPINRLTKEIFAEYDSLLELAEEEQSYHKQDKEVPADLRIKIDNCIKKIEPNKTIDVLLNEGIELKKYQEEITKERKKIVYLFLGIAIEMGNSFYDNSNWLEQSKNTSKEDVIQWAIMGLIRASHNASFYTKFIKYAKWVIKNEIIINSNGSARTITPSRIMVDKMIKYSKFEYNTLMKKGYRPTDEEIIRETKLTPEDIRKIKLIMKEPTSLDSFTCDDIKLGDIIPDKECINHLEEITESEKYEQIREAVSELKGTYAKIIRLRHGFCPENSNEEVNPMTLEKIGKLFGTGRENIRQKEEKAINQLRKKLEILGITV